MQLSNDLEGRNLLARTIFAFYRSDGDRIVKNFLRSEDKEQGYFYTHFLVDAVHVIRYGIGQDRGILLGGVEIAIGPHYFSPADFWSYENSERFTLEASTEGVVHNLKLLDEFWGLGRK
jgi:hypothetical protein